MKRGINVLQVAGICDGGTGRHVRSLCQGLVAQGHRVTIASAPHRFDRALKEFVAERHNDISHIPLSVQREISPMSDLPVIYQLLSLIKREGPFDVVHGHSAKGGAIARIVGRWSGIPTVYTPHGLIMTSPAISRSHGAAYTMIERILGRWATSRFIAVSDEEYEFSLKQRLVPANRTTLIKNGISDEDLRHISEDAIRKDINRKPLTFGSTMRLDTQKAPGCLVEAFVRLCAALPRVPMRLVIAGDGELIGKVKRQAEASGLGEKISLLGWRADVRAVLQELDVFVVSSLYEAGLSYSTMEAMAAKLPIVSTSVFGTRALSRVPGNILVPVGDCDALAYGMKQMAGLADRGSLRQSLQEIGQANHNYIREYFKQQESTQRTLEVYREMCKRSEAVS